MMERDEFAQRVMAMEQRLYRVARSILRSDHDCADAAQEAITIAYQKLHQLRQPAHFQAWLIRILIHQCYAICRRSRRAIPAEIADVSSAPEQSSTLYEGIEALSAPLRIPLVLHYIEGFSVAEIAHMLSIPQGTVKSRLHRGRRQLEAWLSEERRELS